MPHTFTREELYELVWSKPISKLAGEFGLSDVGLAKACKKANIPRPPRGYWAKLAAGKKVFRHELPMRGPGMSDEVFIGRRADRYRSYWTNKEILDSEPEPPVFEGSIADVAMRVKDMVRRVSVPRLPDKAHPQIRRLLEEEEERRQKQAASTYAYGWDKPIFDDKFERRRLRVLNAIVTALQRAGMRPSVRGREGRELGVEVNDTYVSYTLDSTSQKLNEHYRTPIETRGPSNKLRLVIKRVEPSSGIQSDWEDTNEFKLEKQLTEIVCALILTGEQFYRESRQYKYERLVERKAELIEELRRQKEEAERKERERIAALERARLEKLRADARDLREAENIRRFVAEVLALGGKSEIPVRAENLESWRMWALAQADKVDPIRSGRFIEGIHDEAVDRDS